MSVMVHTATSQCAAVASFMCCEWDQGELGMVLAQGQMLLGEAITRGAPQVLWECSALVLGSEPGELALNWPHELVTVFTFLPLQSSLTSL